MLDTRKNESSEKWHIITKKVGQSIWIGVPEDPPTLTWAEAGGSHQSHPKPNLAGPQRKGSAKSPGGWSLHSTFSSACSPSFKHESVQPPRTTSFRRWSKISMKMIYKMIILQSPSFAHENRCANLVKGLTQWICTSTCGTTDHPQQTGFG